MDKSTIQPLDKPHTQTLMGQLTPVAMSIAEKAVRPSPGQPTKRTPEIIEEICARLEEGQALTMICNDPRMPGLRTVNTWKRNDPELQAKFNVAREEGAYVLDDIAELIARKVEGFATGDFRYDDLLVSVLAQRKRYANRGRFGDKQQVEVSIQDPFVFEGWMLPGQIKQDVIDVKPDDTAE